MFGQMETPLANLTGPANIPENYFMDWFRSRVEPYKYQSDEYFKKYAETIKINLRYSEKMYLTEFITDVEINSWHRDNPVFISAQTGTGKNYFIQHQLLRHLYEENKQNRTDYKILILSNRIALGRQSKQDFAESIARITGNTSYLENFDNYTPQGIDRLYSDFGLVQILSYQAFASSNILSVYDFKYIICDECHFFTSDGLFNPTTDVIMHKIVWKARNAVRIYMSATPDVAFAPIILSEYHYLEDTLEKKKDSETKKLNTKQFFDTIVGHNCGNENLESNYLEIEKTKAQIQQMVPKLNIDFYYMERNYDYIENFYYYADDDELLNEVVKTDENNKWLIFVSSKRYGNELLEKIQKKNDQISVTFLTAESKSLTDSDNERETYEKLVNEQTFDEDVLITTSVLDNGVNIRAETIKNVVIDYCDRTEFIQMLGRLRVTPNTKINLYIPTYSEEKIQRNLRRTIQSLVDRLMFDIGDVNFKQSKFNKQLHRYTNDGNFATYNSNAIFQLIDTINFQMSLMRVSDPNFNLDKLIEDLDIKNPIDFSSDCRKIYNYYMQKGGIIWSRNKKVGIIWSRNIVDILTTYDDIQQRQKWTLEDERINEWGNRYDFKFNDNFTRYLFEVLIPDYFENAIDNKIQNISDRLSDVEKDWYRHFKAQTPNNKPLTKYEEFQDLQGFVKRFGFGISIDEVKKLYDKQQYYHGLGTSELQTDLCFEDMLLNEQMKWLEKNIDDCQPIPTESKNSEFLDLRAYIIKNAVSLEDVENQKSGNYVNRNFLEKHGIPHDEKNPTAEEKRFCEEFREGKPFNRGEVNKNCFKTDKYLYRLNSYNATGNRKTYYVFVKIEKE